MKTGTITLFLFLLFITGSSQDFNYEYHGRFTPSVKKEKLSEARFISDIMPEFCRYFLVPYKERVTLNMQFRLIDSFPDYYGLSQEHYNRIVDFVSIVISASSSGKTFTSQSSSDALTMEQKNILNTADPGTDIIIKIKFKFKYGANNELDNGNTIKEGEYVVTVVPETEAEYPGGFKQMTAYLTEHFFAKITETGSSEKIRQAIVKFTISEEGQPVDVKISRTSTDPKIDKLLLEAITKMPKWIPAKNSKGIKVRQEFSIPLGGGGGC